MPDQKVLNEAYPIIDRLAKSRSRNGAFAYYENSDVYQEVWCMCLEALDRYDSEIGPIENYLVRHVTNRIKNLKRDKYFRPGSDVFTSGLARTRMNLINALPIDNDETMKNGILLNSSSININPIDYVLCDETLEYIVERLSDDLIEVFMELINNNKVRRSLVEELQQNIIEILRKRDKYVKN